MLDALGFLTVVGRSRTPTPRSLAWFGPTGALIGAALGLLWWGTTNAWSPAVAAAIVVAADLAVTGMLHLDGLADAADGLLPHLERRRRLAVMAAPEVGAFGVATVVATLLLRFAALATMTPDGWHGVAYLAGVWCAARTLMAVTACITPYARGVGLANAFLGGSVAAPLVLGGPLTALAVGRGLGGVVAVIAGLLGGAFVVIVAQRRIGGFTGDVLGAAGIVTETIALVVASARW
jgi:adenosylcobinamide-GDP ribazoletransferase